MGVSFREKVHVNESNDIKKKRMKKLQTLRTTIVGLVSLCDVYYYYPEDILDKQNKRK